MLSQNLAIALRFIGFVFLHANESYIARPADDDTAWRFRQDEDTRHLMATAQANPAAIRS